MSQLITNSQKQILLYLYKFRFLTTTHFQKLFNHKKPQTDQEWLKDLKDQGYIVSRYSRGKRDENTKPSVYYLGSKARHILKKEEGCELEALNLIYKEKRKSEKFIEHCLTLADIYLYILSQKEENEEIKFFTKTTLTGYDYFPEPFPDAFIIKKDKEQTRMYFLDLFDDYTPSFVYRKRVKQYLKYSADGDWGANTNNSPFPTLLFVCPSETTKKHVYWYGKSVIAKSFEQVSLHVTTKDIIKFAKDSTTVWQEVKEEE